LPLSVHSKESMESRALRWKEQQKVAKMRIAKLTSRSKPVQSRVAGFASILNSQRSLFGFFLRVAHRLEQCCGIDQPGCSGLDFGQLCVLPALLAHDGRRI
jgi:hypothetical protein